MGNAAYFICHGYSVKGGNYYLTISNSTNPSAVREFPLAQIVQGIVIHNAPVQGIKIVGKNLVSILGKETVKVKIPGIKIEPQTAQRVTPPQPVQNPIPNMPAPQPMQRPNPPVNPQPVAQQPMPKHLTEAERIKARQEAIRAGKGAKSYATGSTFNFRGKQFNSLRELAEAYRKPYAVVSDRLASGWTLPEALGLAERKSDIDKLMDGENK